MRERERMKRRVKEREKETKSIGRERNKIGRWMRKFIQRRRE